MKNLYEYIKFLGLKKPVNLRIITRKNRWADAEYEPEYSDKTGKLKEHKITIFFKNNTRDFDTLVAHELIHAWQEENKKSETRKPKHMGQRLLNMRAKWKNISDCVRFTFQAQIKNRNQGLQTKMNTFVCRPGAPILYLIILGRVKGFAIDFFNWDD